MLQIFTALHYFRIHLKNNSELDGTIFLRQSMVEITTPREFAQKSMKLISLEKYAPCKYSMTPPQTTRDRIMYLEYTSLAFNQLAITAWQKK